MVYQIGSGGSVVVTPNKNQSLVVTIKTAAGTTPTVYQSDRTTSITMSTAITATTAFYVNTDDIYTVSCKDSGVEVANPDGTKRTVPLSSNDSLVFVPSVPQVVQSSATKRGYITQAYIPEAISTTSTPLATAGTVYCVKLNTPVATTVTNIVYSLTTGGGTLTTAQCFAGIAQGGVYLGFTGDQSTNFAGTGVKTAALTTPVAVAAGDFYVVFWFNGTTGPALGRGASASTVINDGNAAAVSLYGTSDTSITTVPAATPNTFGTVSALAVSYWAAVS